MLLHSCAWWRTILARASRAAYHFARGLPHRNMRSMPGARCRHPLHGRPPLRYFSTAPRVHHAASTSVHWAMACAARLTRALFSPPILYTSSRFPPAPDSPSLDRRLFAKYRIARTRRLRRINSTARAAASLPVAGFLPPRNSSIASRRRGVRRWQRLRSLRKLGCASLRRLPLSRQPYTSSYHPWRTALSRCQHWFTN